MSDDTAAAIAAVKTALAAEREAWAANDDRVWLDRKLEARAVAYENAPALLALAKSAAAKDAEIERLRAALTVAADFFDDHAEQYGEHVDNIAVAYFREKMKSALEGEQ